MIPTYLYVSEYIVTCQAHPALVKKWNQMCGSFLLKIFCLGGYLACLKDPWPRVLSLPKRFVGDPVSLARDNIMSLYNVVIIINDNSRCI